MRLFDDPLVKEKFGEEPGSMVQFPCTCSYSHNCVGHLIELRKFKRILEAMETPIKEGEKYLDWIVLTKKWKEEVYRNNFHVHQFHPFALRLPDRFQMKEGEDVFEKKIQEIVENESNCRLNEMPSGGVWIETKELKVMLHELIAIVRKETKL